MIDFAKLQGLTIPEGNVTQISDASGRVLWAVSGGKVVLPAVLQVEKRTATTYAGETAYNDEQFILLDIYPKTNGTVKVTYGGLTKTITDTSGAADPNAQTVFFGTFNGVSDEVETPESGRLTIDGDYASYGVARYKGSSVKSGAAPGDYVCVCVTNIINFGEILRIRQQAFQSCAGLTRVDIHSPIEIIDGGAFMYCSNLTSVVIAETVKSIGTSAFLGAPSEGSPTVTMLSPTPPTIGEIAFKANSTIIVPKGSIEAYKAAEGWSTGGFNFVEASE